MTLQKCVYFRVFKRILRKMEMVWFGVFVIGISTIVGYLMAKLFFKKNSSGTI